MIANDEYVPLTILWGQYQSDIIIYRKIKLVCVGATKRDSGVSNWI